MFTEHEISKIAAAYGIKTEAIGEVIDSSHGDTDIRLVYQINEDYILHIYSAEFITEEMLQGIKRLVQRYRQMDIWAPDIISQKDEDLLLLVFEKDNVNYRCCIEEAAPFSFADQEKTDIYDMKSEMLNHLGRFAEAYSGVDLSANHSMWSVIDLSPYDNEVDEKQENFDMLCEAIPDKDLVSKMRKLNFRARGNLMACFEELPRCVFQGDLNPSNILVDEENHFRGIIDFNLSGTEVNINCFLNESMYYFKKEDFEKETPKGLLDKADNVQKRLMSVILNSYTLNESEKKVYMDYWFIIYTGFYPNVMLMIDCMQGQGGAEKVTEYLRLVCSRYEKSL